MTQPTGLPPRVLLADADAPTRVALRAALVADGFEAVAEAVAEADVAQAAVAAAIGLDPDGAMVAASLPGGGIDAARQIAAENPRMRLVVVSDDPSGEELLEAVLAGASGYLGRDVSQQRLPTALRAVLAGEVALPRRHTQYLLEALRGRDVRRAAVSARASSPIIDREWEVLQPLADDASTAEIAHLRGHGAPTLLVDPA
jgi:DNA-binding NarL/FixJ family response regulator